MSGTLSKFHIPNCSNVTFDQLLHVNLVRGISGIACFLISVTLLFSLLFIFRAYKNILQRLILYYAIATTIYQAFNISFLEHQFQKCKSCSGRRNEEQEFVNDFSSSVNSLSLHKVLIEPIALGAENNHYGAVDNPTY